MRDTVMVLAFAAVIGFSTYVIGTVVGSSPDCHCEPHESPPIHAADLGLDPDLEIR